MKINSKPPMHEKQRSFEYLAIYDFDGTVYCERLIKNFRKKNQVLPGQKDQYFAGLSRADIVRGFGGSDRVQCLKMHFEKLKSFNNQLGIVLICEHQRRHLETLFNGIGVDMNGVFDDVHCATEVTERKEKHTIIKEFGAKYAVNVSTNSVLYVD